MTVIRIPLPGFYDSWVWFIFVAVGLLLIIMELILGVDTGLDLVFIGTALIIAGLVTWPFYSWNLTLIVTAIICAAYLVLLRKYVRRWRESGKSKTNVDAIIGKTGTVIKGISRSSDGRVKVGNEEWKARAEQEINPGEEIVVTGITGVTLTVEKL